MTRPLLALALLLSSVSLCPRHPDAPAVTSPVPAPRVIPTHAARSRALFPVRRLSLASPPASGRSLGSGEQRTLNWAALAQCESSNNPRTNTGNGYYGLYQFDLSTWRSVGGHGLPRNASRSEQTYRAALLYADRGRQPWPTCGRRL